MEDNKNDKPLLELFLQYAQDDGMPISWEQRGNIAVPLILGHSLYDTYNKKIKADLMLDTYQLSNDLLQIIINNDI